MRFTKISLIAAMLIGSSAFAIENTKVSGDARLYYGTQDSDAANAPSMFSKNSGYTNFAARLDLTTDLTKGVSAGVGTQVVTTLGVEHNLVDSVWSNAHTAKASNGATFAGGTQVDSAMWFDEVWLAGSAFDTTLKIGRQALDTPLAFSEKWGVDKNTFEAVVLINQSIKDTTLVGTFIGKSNGSADDRMSIAEGGAGSLNDVGTITGGAISAKAGYVATDGTFSTFGTNGTYAFGVVNNSFKPLTLQAWYYDMVNMATAYWLQADAKCSAIKGLSVGLQYMNTEADAMPSADTTGFSAMIGYELKDVVTIKAAYSSISDDGLLGVANTATGSFATVGGQSKLYTEMWWNYGLVSAVGSDSYSLTAETTVGPNIGLLAGFYYADIAPKGAGLALFAEKEVTEVTVAASKTFGPLSTSLALIYTDTDAANNANDLKTTDVQVYLTYNF